ncbi:hypothetical protein QNH10_02350 [Sporosarcina thermotolerans]|uniref:hypothetical protein n=1 Tax=Sporosarcina thermotolerans TaxID=633404 RepID=UPI0024BBF0C7|nr:hypothetical protein [Sporosarcina thermotolerans]WHT48660.1 hypothetical protein QNH10_02350 [Sporosarcina thermotolerans]
MRKYLSKVLVITALSFGLSFGASSLTFAERLDNGVPDSSILESESYVIPEINSVSPDKNALFTTQTVSHRKQYHNLYGINVATQIAYVQWTYNGSNILSYDAIWQSLSTAIGYGYTNDSISDNWNLRGVTGGQANQSVEFDSGIPTHGDTSEVPNLQAE